MRPQTGALSLEMIWSSILNFREMSLVFTFAPLFITRIKWHQSRYLAYRGR